MIQEVKYMNLHNDTDFPFMIDSWVDGSNTLKCLEVKPREKLVIHSSVGEWHMNSMFTNREMRKIWVDKGLDYMVIVGKFRSRPCASGDYVWLDYNSCPFNFEYSEVENPEDNIKGLMTITYVEN